jgi:hypothetical protein
MTTFYGKNKDGNYGFFDDRIHKIINKDWLEINRDQYLYLLKEQSKGGKIVPDKNGYPIIKDDK